MTAKIPSAARTMTGTGEPASRGTRATLRPVRRRTRRRSLKLDPQLLSAPNFDPTGLLHPRLLAGRSKFVPGVPGRQAIGVCDLAAHVERESSQDGESGEVPVRPDLVLRRM